MPEYKDFEGKTTQDALDLAVERTGISPSNMNFEILQPGGGGIFGISFKKAKIRVFFKTEEEPQNREEQKVTDRKKTKAQETTGAVEITNAHAVM